MIIDAHAHLGDCMVFDHLITEEELISQMDANGVDASLVFPLPGVTDAYQTHNAIAALNDKHEGRIYGIVSMNPHTDENKYFSEVERCINDLGFVGIKLHPQGHACPISVKDADKVFIAAQQFKVPVIIHTGVGAPFTLPSMLIPRARQYPDLKIVMAHAGAYIFTWDAIVAAAECSNIYLETSWCGPHHIKRMVGTFGANRLLFGSDLPINIATELTKYRTINLTNEQLEMCLGGTVKKVFNL